MGGGGGGSAGYVYCNRIQNPGIHVLVFHNYKTYQKTNMEVGIGKFIQSKGQI